MKAEEIYAALYEGQRAPIAGYSLDEIRVRPIFSDVEPRDVDLSSSIGPVKLNIPLLSAAMDTVTGSKLACALHEVGGCGVIYRHKKESVQLEWLEQAVTHEACLIRQPKSLLPESTLEDAREILEGSGYSIIPVISRENKLLGVIFTHDIAFNDKLGDSVSKWMKPLSALKVEKHGASFAHIRDRLINEQSCSVLPLIDESHVFKGIYFMKDFINTNPSYLNGKPLVGLAVGVHKEDLNRVRAALELGAGMYVIDSSHGNCTSVIEQARRTVQLVKDRGAVVAGNITDIDGYLRLAEVGVHAVKIGIGSGATCTTSTATGAGMPLFTLIRELSYTRQRLVAKGSNAPAIICDGGMDHTGNMVVALAAGANACMVGKLFVAAQESISYQEHGETNGHVYYRGMASAGAIKSRSSDRYGKQKSAPEGLEGLVPYRGPLKKWIGHEKEWLQGGFSHVGAKDLPALQQAGDRNYVFVRFTAFGKEQINVRLS